MSAPTAGFEVVMRFAIITLGCKVNQYESQAMEQWLTERGHVQVRPEEDFDLIFLSNSGFGDARSAVAELVCELATETDIARLRECIRMQRFNLESYYSDSLMELDNRFHETLFQIARKQEVYRLMQGIAIHFDRVRGMALDTVKNHRIVADHEMIVSTIGSRNKSAARALMERKRSISSGWDTSGMPFFDGRCRQS